MAELPSVELGQVVGAHGLRGEIRIRYFGDGPESLLEIPEFWLAEHLGDSRARRFEVERARPGRAGEVRIALVGLGDRDSAAALRGMLVLGDRQHLPELEAGEVYWHQLVGCRVEAEDGRLIGTVSELWDTGAHDVLVVEDEAGRRHLIPTARELVPEIDLEDRRVVVAMIPGLIESP